MVAPRNRGKVFGANSFVINIFTLFLPPLAATLVASPGPLAISILGITIAAVVVLFNDCYFAKVDTIESVGDTNEKLTKLSTTSLT